MAIELYEHNRTAYQAALDMLETTGKSRDHTSYGDGEIIHWI